MPELGAKTRTPVFVDPTGRRRRAVRAALAAFLAGSLALVTFVVIGLKSGAYAPRTILGLGSSPRPHILTADGGSEDVGQSVGQSVGESSPSAPSGSPRLSSHSAPPPSGSSPPHSAAPPQHSGSPAQHSDSPGHQSGSPGQQSGSPGQQPETGSKSGQAARTTGLGWVAAAFNGDGVATAGHASAGNFDGGGFSFEARQLDGDGFGPGDKIAADC
jgi:hypothetical protein